jgi:hypothetical protein
MKKGKVDVILPFPQERRFSFPGEQACRIPFFSSLPDRAIVVRAVLRRTVQNPKMTAIFRAPDSSEQRESAGIGNSA